MTNLKTQIAQLIIPRLDGNRLNEKRYYEDILSLVDSGIGGFIIFGGEILRTTEMIKGIQDRASLPLFITSDIERGLGQQLAGGTAFPNQLAVSEAIAPGDIEDLILLQDMLNVIRNECIAAGINVVFSPVADVNINPDNPIICTRSFGEDPGRVAWFVTEYVRGLQRERSALDSRQSKISTQSLLACAKHFPGHGDTAVDSHNSLPVINADRERLDRVELPPFRAAIDAGVGMVMIGHLQVPALEPDPIPATFSRRIVTGLLKEELGFKGLVVTDALDMGALRSICDEAEAAVRCLEAGCDLLLHPSEPFKILNAIVKAVEDGRVSEGRVQEAYGKVDKIKGRWSMGGERRFVDNQQARDVAFEIAKKGVKFRKGEGSRLAGAPVCLVIDDDGDGSVAMPFLDALKEKFPLIRMVALPEDIRRDETAVIPVFSRISAWKGSSGISKTSAEKIREAVEKAGQSFLISFGSPYILNSFNAGVMINAFDPADFMQRAVVERLFSRK